jgi:ribose-phosphate pyrophosphokinase
MNKNKKTKAKTRANLRVFGGSSHPTLTKSIARKVGVRQGEVTLGKFANNEISVALQENVRGQVSLCF